MKKTNGAMVIFRFVCFAALLAGMVLPHAALANSTGGGLPYETWLTKLQTSMTGPVAMGVSLAGILGAGGALIFAHQELGAFLKTLVFVVLVAGLLVGATTVLTWMGGSACAIG